MHLNTHFIVTDEPQFKPNAVCKVAFDPEIVKDWPIEQPVEYTCACVEFDGTKEEIIEKVIKNLATILTHAEQTDVESDFPTEKCRELIAKYIPQQ